MHVIATAGHVDHGKSTLVRALTGMEPDRWAEERRRGMTIDLGYAWTDLPSGQTLAFVDVPGHQRFIGNMLAGLGPVPAVMVVVAADEGWREQSTEHLAAVTALDIRFGLLVVTRSDLADPVPAILQSRRRLAGSSLSDVEAIAVSGATGWGLPELRAALDRLVARLPPPAIQDRVRLWVDRAFTIRGSGTVVTGTLGAGSVQVGDRLDLRGEPAGVRGLQTLGNPQQRVAAVARVAVNLRSVPREAVSRGDVLLSPDRWRRSRSVDVRLVGARTPTGTAPGFPDLPSQLTLYVGTAAVPVHVRPLGTDTARLQLARSLPLAVGDRAILSDRARLHLPRGVLVLDADPVPLRRRGAAAARAAELAAVTDRTPSLRDHVRWRAAVRLKDAQALGISTDDLVGLRQAGEWLVDADRWLRWVAELAAAVDAHASAAPHDPFLPVEAARSALGLPGAGLPDTGPPDAGLVAELAAAAGLQSSRGAVSRAGRLPSLGPAEASVEELETLLRGDPFAAPDRVELERLALGHKDLAVAGALGRLIRLDRDVVLLPDAPARAMSILAALPQPFTTSQARNALGSSRRVVIPLLEHLDARGWTLRLDPDHRRVCR